MAVALKIDFVSDMSCPWCAVGLMALEQAIEQAIERVEDDVAVELHFQPFELNPSMPPEEPDSDEHLIGKYRPTPEQLAQNFKLLRQRGAELDFQFNRRSRVHNTFDAHRLLHWAGEQGRDAELALKHALLRAYFSEGLDVSAHDVLARLAGDAGLDPARARTILDSQEYSAEVRAQEQRFMQRDIRAVPSVIINDQHLIQGGQPVALFEQALRQVAADAGAAPVPL